MLHVKMIICPVSRWWLYNYSDIVFPTHSHIIYIKRPMTVFLDPSKSQMFLLCFHVGLKGYLVNLVLDLNLVQVKIFICIFPFTIITIFWAHACTFRIFASRSFPPHQHNTVPACNGTFLFRRKHSCSLMVPTKLVVYEVAVTWNIEWSS